jgi:hypothetical protein
MMADFGFRLISGNPALPFGEGSVGAATLKTIYFMVMAQVFTIFISLSQLF